MTTKVWNLMYALGNTSRIVGDAGNPQSRKSALEGAATVDRNGWRVWVEHHTTGKRLYENDREKAHRESNPPMNKETLIEKLHAGHELYNRGSGWWLSAPKRLSGAADAVPVAADLMTSLEVDGTLRIVMLTRSMRAELPQ